MQGLLLFIELVIAIALVILILLQKSEGGALGIGGGGGGAGGLFTPRGAGDVLTRTTSILGVMFFLVCIALNLVVLNGRQESSILDQAPATKAPVTQPKPAAPPTPALPVGPSVPKPQ